MTKNEFRVLVATDGSAHARRAISITLRFPWPVRTRVRAVSLDGLGQSTGAPLCWRLSIAVPSSRLGAPLRDLLVTAAETRAHVVVIGARGVSGLRHLLPGSVAEGTLNRCPMPVMVVR